jgi:hypothetical protein
MAKCNLSSRFEYEVAAHRNKHVRGDVIHQSAVDQRFVPGRRPRAACRRRKPPGRFVSSGVLGLTLQCARCHDHKYDPVAQTDYYGMQAIFMSGYRPSQWVPQVQRRILEASETQEKEAKAHNAKVDAAVAPLKKQIEELKKQKDQTEKLAALTKELQAEEAKRRVLPEIRAFYDLPGDAKTRLLRRGDYLNPGPEVRPGVLSVLTTPRPFDWSPPPADAKTSGRRRAFAEWLTQPEHPLTARVFVNRPGLLTSKTEHALRARFAASW